MKQHEYSILGKNIREIRQNKKISQRDASKKAGVTESCLSQIELGKNLNPGILTVKKITDALGVSINQVLHEQNLVIEGGCYYERNI